MKKCIIALLLSTPIQLTIAADHDHSPCTKEPEKKWQPFSVAAKKVEDMGHTIKAAEVHHKCYEFRGKSKDGKRFELSINPVSLEPHK
ncbi:PepSY domain-containing protein [Chitinivorax sp. B]|uniref:PepSY domain-containing protein n=1 Tax=Chitinivorax sp. B TaxID=2502235 RepID=UPI0010F78831|nr:PepSY domain-containing protein [Chitinivorax sp. B]